MKVNVKYSGKRLPFTARVPWLNAPVMFGESREAVMDQGDAERLCGENPTDFEIIGEVVIEEPEPIEEPAAIKKPPNKRKSGKKR